MEEDLIPHKQLYYCTTASSRRRYSSVI